VGTVATAGKNDRKRHAKRGHKAAEAMDGTAAKVWGKERRNDGR